MKRKIVHIDSEKCNGCGLCVNACHEGAIELIDGKAKLISDEYCDGLGDCLPVCPVDAIKIIERDADNYNEQLVKKKMEEKNQASAPLPCGCPGTAARSIERKHVKSTVTTTLENSNEAQNISELRQWPVQLKLVNPNADYFKNANLLVAADCTAYSYANFHRDFIKNHTTVIGCPKLDDNEYYEEKLTEILKNNDIKSITVVRMQVPCCRGIVASVKNAMLKSGVIVPYREVTLSIEGEII